MILKRLHEEYGFNIEPLLIKESKRLKLSTKELSVLLVLFSNPSRSKIFTLNSIARRVDYSVNELSEIINQLMSKKFIDIKLELHNKREREIYSLDGTYEIITALFEEDEKEKQRQQSQNDISEAIGLLEDKFGRMLKANELDRVRSWYETFNFEQANILTAIENAKSNSSIIYIEKMLNLSLNENIEIDKKTDEFLDDLFKKL